ncbi:HET-domain-containing protein [Penicillium daleae]|uniref:HET-domain-containing protein n=1 Tax=Penicillium daleae TaxID=63821 RepID=A0AAD6G7G8_9EURO|nr:HET-domain-containing protein [Penicillium daleae]KAJ5461605.1 HET-domain-containing protein [Penicillium daleae]
MGANNSSEVIPCDTQDRKADKCEAYLYCPLSTTTCIRTLEILPERLSTPNEVYCNITEVNLEDEPIFDALSYTWGPARTVYRSNESLPQEDAYHRTKNVICDGKILKVTENCFAALKQIRSMKDMNDERLDGLIENRRNGRLWVDAICVNQSGDQQALAEKASQIRIMDRIYRQAQTVLIWLGPEDEFSRDAILCLRLIADRRLLEKAPEVRHYAIQAEEPYEQLDIPYIDTTKWLAIYAFLHRAYFYRSWISQEVAFARKPVVICGTLVFPWEVLSHAALFLCIARWYPQVNDIARLYLEGETDSEVEEERMNRTYAALEGYQTLKENPFMRLLIQSMERSLNQYPRRNISAGFFKESQRIEYNPAVHILELSDLRFKHTYSEVQGYELVEPLPVILMKCRFAKTSEPQDSIYALLSLASAPSWSGLSIDYTRPVWQSFLDAAWAMIRSSGNVRLFSLVEDRSLRKVKGLPTWVPDFTTERKPDPWDAGDPCPYRAGGETVWREDIAWHIPMHIVVQGLHYDTVQKVQRFECFNLSSIAELSECLSNMPFDHIWRTLVGDKFLRQYPAPDYCNILFSNLLQSYLRDKNMLMYLRVRGLPTLADKFLEADRDFRSAFASWNNLQGSDILDHDGEVDNKDDYRREVEEMAGFDNGRSEDRANLQESERGSLSRDGLD